MPDFSKLLKAPAGVAKRAPALMPADYPGVIKSHELVGAPEGKDYKSIVRFHLGLTGWPDEVDEQDRVEGTAGWLV